MTARELLDTEWCFIKRQLCSRYDKEECYGWLYGHAKLPKWLKREVQIRRAKEAV